MHIFKRHKLNPPPPKRCSDVFRSKIDLWVAPKLTKVEEMLLSQAFPFSETC